MLLSNITPLCPFAAVRAPSDRKSHRGLFAATGDFHWRFLRPEGQASSSTPAVTVSATRSYQPLPGSNELYHFRAESLSKPEIKASFVQCYCKHHKAGQPGLCRFDFYVDAQLDDPSKGPETFLTNCLDRE